MDCKPVLQQFLKLWNSPEARKVTQRILEQLLDEERRAEQYQKSLRQQDRPPPERSPFRAGFVDDKKNYVIHRHPDKEIGWKFDIAERKFNGYQRRGEFFLVVVCDYETAYELIFAIPSSYLKQNILPHAKREHNGKIFFMVHKKTYEFLWRSRVKMDGRPFLLG